MGLEELVHMNQVLMQKLLALNQRAENAEALVAALTVAASSAPAAAAPKPPPAGLLLNSNNLFLPKGSNFAEYDERGHRQLFSVTGRTSEEFYVLLCAQKREPKARELSLLKDLALYMQPIQVFLSGVLTDLRAHGLDSFDPAVLLDSLARADASASALYNGLSAHVGLEELKVTSVAAQNELQKSSADVASSSLAYQLGPSRTVKLNPALAAILEPVLQKVEAAFVGQMAKTAGVNAAAASASGSKPPQSQSQQKKPPAPPKKKTPPSTSSGSKKSDE